MLFYFDSSLFQYLLIVARISRVTNQMTQMTQIFQFLNLKVGRFSFIIIDINFHF